MLFQIGDAQRYICYMARTDSACLAVLFGRTDQMVNFKFSSGRAKAYLDEETRHIRLGRGRITFACPARIETGIASPEKRNMPKFHSADVLRAFMETR